MFKQTMYLVEMYRGKDKSLIDTTHTSPLAVISRFLSITNIIFLALSIFLKFSFPFCVGRKYFFPKFISLHYFKKLQLIMTSITTNTFIHYIFQKLIFLKSSSHEH